MNKSKFAPLFTFLVLFTFTLLVGGTIPYFLLYVLLLIYLIPLAHCLINYFFLDGKVEIPQGNLYTGDLITIKYKIINKSIFPITYLEIENDLSKKLTGNPSPKVTLSIEKKQFYQRSETIILKRRGFYELGEINVIIKDVFGFFSIKKKISNTTSLLVYPEIISLSSFKTATSQQSGELLNINSYFLDKSRIADLREYIEGDSIKSIHWKLTAKKDITIVKEYENRGDTQVSIFIDNELKLFKDDIDYHLEDKIVDVATSIINYCLSQNIKVTLETQDGNNYINMQGQQNTDFKHILETLAKFKGNGTLDFSSFIMPRINNINRGVTIVIITTNLDKEMGALGIYLKMKNLNPLFIVITDKENKTGSVDGLIEKRLKIDGIPVYLVDYKTSVKDILEGYYG